MEKTEKTITRIALVDLINKLRNAVLEEDNFQSVDEIMEKIRNEYVYYNEIHDE